MNSCSVVDAANADSVCFLSPLTQACYVRHIPVHNVEFRAACTCSYKGLSIGAKGAALCFLPEGKKVFRILQNIVSEIKLYDDGQALNDYYAVLVSWYEHLFEQSWFKAIYNTEFALQTIVKTDTGLYRTFIKQLCSNFEYPSCAINFDDIHRKAKNVKAMLFNLIKAMRAKCKSFPEFSDILADEYVSEIIIKGGGNSSFENFLLDARIVHQIHTAPYKQPLFVLAGDSHTDNVINALQAADYIVVDSCPTAEQLGGSGPDGYVVDIKEYMAHTPMYHVDSVCCQYLQLLDNAPLGVSERYPITEYIKTTIDKDPFSALCLLKKMVEKEGMWDFALDIIHECAASKNYVVDPRTVHMEIRIVEIVLEQLCGQDLEDIVKYVNALEMLDTQQTYTADDLVNEIIKCKARNDSAFLSWISLFISALKFKGHFLACNLLTRSFMKDHGLLKQLPSGSKCFKGMLEHLVFPALNAHKFVEAANMVHLLIRNTADDAIAQLGTCYGLYAGTLSNLPDGTMGALVKAAIAKQNNEKTRLWAMSMATACAAFQRPDDACSIVKEVSSVDEGEQTLSLAFNVAWASRGSRCPNHAFALNREIIKRISAEPTHEASCPMVAGRPLRLKTQDLMHVLSCYDGFPVDRMCEENVDIESVLNFYREKKQS